MIERVGNGTGYDYPHINEKKVNSGATGTGEKFQLDYGKEGAIYEPSNEAVKKQQADKSVSSHRVDPQKAEDEGVRLTLSNSGYDKLEAAKKESTTQSGGLFKTVTDLVNKFIIAIKGIFSNFWNDDAAQVSEVNETKEETEEEVKAVEEVTPVSAVTSDRPQSEFDKVKAEAEAFLRSAEGKKAARNSDLLTYYDKHGVVVNVNASDRQRILYGDKNQIEV